MPPPAAARPRASRGQHSFLARLIPPPSGARARRRPGVPRSVAELGAALPLERKVAQLFLVGFAGQDLTAPVFGELRGSTWAAW